jgi:DNA invertase Pin-like site-specific DNA recombinase
VQALIDAIKARKVSTVYAESLDRISRDSGDLHHFRKLLKHYGSDFVSIANGMKLDGSSGSPRHPLRQQRRRYIPSVRVSMLLQRPKRTVP